MNIIGLIFFSCYSDYNLLEIFYEPLYKEKIKEINSNLLNNNIKENKITRGNNTNIYDNEKNALNGENVNDYLNQETPGNDNNNNDIHFETYDKNKLIGEIENLQKENAILKNEINELKSQNKSQNLQIRTLQVKIQNLEELNDKLSEKIAILNEKENTT